MSEKDQNDFTRLLRVTDQQGGGLYEDVKRKYDYSQS
jgi:hypothetical protein